MTGAQEAWCSVITHHMILASQPGSPKHGIPVPLFNLVYHDCLIEPWMMEKIDDTEDYMLYALLNGGAPYLIRDGAYPDFDGSLKEMLRCISWRTSRDVKW